MKIKSSKAKKTIFVCQSCGHSTPRWAGKCPNCSEWNSLAEEMQFLDKNKRQNLVFTDSEPVLLSEVETKDSLRIKSDSQEFDRVLGGGLVPGSLILISGDPGIGKSTLLLQQMVGYAKVDCKVLYISGEESIQQVRMRSSRLKLEPDNLWIYSEITLTGILSEVEKIKPQIIVVDSIQTLYNPEFDSAPGSVTQLRECTMAFLQLAKSREVTVFLIGHVTKEGAIAGPRALEHMVDALLYLEGDRQYQYRILRGIKNRFGSTNEIGVFELGEDGLTEVENPSQLFLSEHQKSVSGSAVTCAIEGTRPILLEIQALTSSASFGMPQRTATGIEHKRLALLLAILEKRAGYHIGQYDVFIKIAGGLRVNDPSADLALIMAIAAGYRDFVLDSTSLYLGEVGLGGEIRSVSQLDLRLKEADLLGFKTAYIPKQKLKNLNLKKLQLIEVGDINHSLKKMKIEK